jgi:allophanate hydrolase
MNGLVEVVNAGIANSLQDFGRVGYRHMGIAVSGCLDPLLARCANALVGNPAECACIEIRAAGPALAVQQGPVRFALAGDVTATRLCADGSEEAVLPWRSVTLDVGDELQVGFLPGGTSYLAVSGGFATPVQLGSRSTYQRAEIGCPIVFGLQIPCATVPGGGAGEFAAAPWLPDEGRIRVIPGPQDDHFSPAAMADLFGQEYRVTPQSDRMGIRLDGKSLAHRAPAMADIVSDGVTPGVIQVPGNGQPIILLADCQTVGGYPKIATVISADLPRLAQAKPGQPLRFVAVDLAQARAAREDQALRWNHWVAGVHFDV